MSEPYWVDKAIAVWVVVALAALAVWAVATFKPEP